MPAYYFAMEGYPVGEKPDPAVDSVITIQYQKIDLTTGEPLGELKILKAWESSEQSIITTFSDQFFKPQMPVTHFIPVGINLDYEYEMIIAKFKKYNLPVITSHQLYFQRPRFDLKPIIVLLNDGRFTGARLDLFSPKKYDDSHMKKWFEKEEFKKIEHYIREESEAFLKLLQYLNKYKTRLGITRKEEPGHLKSEKTSPPAHAERELPSRPKSPAPVMHMTRKPADGRTPSREERELPSRPKSYANTLQTTRQPAGTRTPAPKKSSARIEKAPSESSRKSPARTKSEGQRTSVPLNQFRKHTPTKKNTGKRG
jgi:hypothetical protein